ncbi:MAG: hypothetical protein GF364_22840 [Candidatus Lokiarchaeota archaeon]|nr:hypothetical protein [Candidatus Lokiarchaeota archaeon]
MPMQFPKQGKQNFWNQQQAQGYQQANPYARTTGSGFAGQQNALGMRRFQQGTGQLGAFNRMLSPFQNGLKGLSTWMNSMTPAPGAAQPYMNYEGDLGRKTMDRGMMAGNLMNTRGLGVAGAANPAANYQANMMRNAADARSNQYRHWMDYVKQDPSVVASLYGTGLNAAANVFGNLLGSANPYFDRDARIRGAEDARNRDIFGMQRQDFMDDLAWQRGEYDRQFSRRNALTQERQRNAMFNQQMEGQGRTRSLIDYLNQMQQQTPGISQNPYVSQINRLKNQLFYQPGFRGSIGGTPGR